MTAAMTRLSTRPISVNREGAHFRLSFSYDQGLLKKVRTLPQAAWDPATRTWTTAVCVQSVDALRRFHHEGLCDPAPDTLVADGEILPVLADAVLRRGTRSRPYVIIPSFRDDQLFARLRALPGATWDKAAGGMALPGVAAAAVAELVQRGVVADPEEVLLTADVTVCFDVRCGEFTVFGDPRAQRSFEANFPQVDVVATWRERGIDADFSDDFSAEVYAGELARDHGSFTSTQMVIPLYDYQSGAVAVARARTGLGVFAPPGLGKSAIGIGLGAECLADGEIPRVVIVCPGAVRTQWAEEITRFSGAHDVAVIGGDAKARKRAFELADSCRWIIVHYDVLDREFDRLKPLCSGALIIADELHRAKNPTAKRTKALHRLARVAQRRLGLTGTPVESSPEEWYWVHQFITPGALGGLDDFRNRYMFQSRWGYEGARNLPDLAKRSKPHHIRFTKAQVTPHLPPLRVRHMPLDPDPAYASMLRRLHREARDEIADDRVQRAGGVLDADAVAAAEMTAVSMLRDACISPRLLHQSDSDAAVALCGSGAVPDVDGPKLDALRRICAELAADDERVVIFTYSERMAQLISERLSEDDVENVLFTGAVSNKDRDIARRRFNDPDDSVRAFIATDAGAEGLNLGKCCSTLVNVDVPWTPTRLEQRSNRIHRVDGTHPNYLVINLTVRGTLEDGLLRMLEAKADISDALFGENDGQARTTGRRAQHSSGRELFAVALAAAAGTETGRKTKPQSSSSTAPTPRSKQGTKRNSGRRGSTPAGGGEQLGEPEVQLGLDLG